MNGTGRIHGSNLSVNYLLPYMGNGRNLHEPAPQMLPNMDDDPNERVHVSFEYMHC